MPCSNKCSEGRIRVRNVLKSTGGSDLCMQQNLSRNICSESRQQSDISRKADWSNAHRILFMHTFMSQPWQQLPSLHVLQKLTKTHRPWILSPNLYLLGNHSSGELYLLLLVITFLALKHGDSQGCVISFFFHLVSTGFTMCLHFFASHTHKLLCCANSSSHQPF